MGATTFGVMSKGKDVQQAFDNAKEEAYYDHGHGGYTGTIAEKSGYKLLTVPKDKSLNEFIDSTIEDNDKWDDAFCVEVGEDEFYFYGWAST